MLARPESLCLLIADISGYTAYLAGAELEHAQDILADLMTTTVGGLRPTFRLAKLEGDAAFAWAPIRRLDPTRLLDVIESTYFGFQRRLRDVRQATSCACNACRLMPRLDLKFVVHAGPVVRQRIAGSEELLGSDVVVVHRLLKNRVTDTTGVAAYALVTDACARQVGLDGAALGLIAVEEQTPDVGLISGWVDDLAAAWRREQDRPRVRLPEHAPIRRESHLPAPPELVWEYLTDPAKRPLWGVGMDEVRSADGRPRRGAGSVNHCIHGKDVLIEEILDWRPPRSLATRTAVPGLGPFVMTTELRPAEGGGTTGVIRGGFGADGQEAVPPPAVAMLESMIDAGQARLREILAAETSALAEARRSEPEAPVPISANRHVTAPVSR